MNKFHLSTYTTRLYTKLFTKIEIEIPWELLDDSNKNTELLAMLYFPGGRTAYE